MEQKNSWIKLTAAAALSALLLSNCVQTYDSYGRPVQTVDPGAALVGAAVIGAIVYSAGNNNSHRYRSNYRYHSGNRYHRSHRRHY